MNDEYDLNGWFNDDLPFKQRSSKKKFGKKDPVLEALERSYTNPFKKGSKEWKRFEDMKDNY